MTLVTSPLVIDRVIRMAGNLNCSSTMNNAVKTTRIAERCPIANLSLPSDEQQRNFLLGISSAARRSFSTRKLKLENERNLVMILPPTVCLFRFRAILDLLPVCCSNVRGADRANASCNLLENLISENLKNRFLSEIYNRRMFSTYAYNISPVVDHIGYQCAFVRNGNQIRIDIGLSRFGSHS